MNLKVEVTSISIKWDEHDLPKSLPNLRNEDSLPNDLPK